MYALLSCPIRKMDEIAWKVMDAYYTRARAVSLKIAKLAFQRIRQYAPLDDRLRRVNLQVIDLKLLSLVGLFNF